MKRTGLSTRQMSGGAMGDIGLMTLCMDANGEDEEDSEEVKALGVSCLVRMCMFQGIL
jgi:hypothetical protein